MQTIMQEPIGWIENAVCLMDEKPVKVRAHSRKAVNYSVIR